FERRVCGRGDARTSRFDRGGLTDGRVGELREQCLERDPRLQGSLAWTMRLEVAAGPQDELLRRQQRLACGERRRDALLRLKQLGAPRPALRSRGQLVGGVEAAVGDVL